jgi:NitT/TauT family transport system permease protein
MSDASLIVSAAAPVGSRSDGRQWRSLASSFLAEGLIVLALLGWTAISYWLGPNIFPSVGAVLQAMGSLLVDLEFASHTLASAVRVISSVMLALLLGTILALIPHYIPGLDNLIHQRLKPLINSFPSIGWAVLVAIYAPMSSASVIFIQVMILTPFCLINVSEGVRALDDEMNEMGRSFTRSRWRRLLMIEFPALAPFMLAAARMSYGVCWKVALVSELFGARSGLGYLMQMAQNNADTALLFATCFMVVVFFRVGEIAVLEPLSRKLNWNKSENESAYV